MNEAATAVIVARSQGGDRLITMVAWSIAAHIVISALVLLLPAQKVDTAPKTIMTISLGGAAGPKTGGMTQMGARAVQAPPPPEEVKRAESAPAPTPPAMTLPDPKARRQPQREAAKNAPRDATSRTPTTGAEPQEGTAKVETRVRGQGFGLSTAGGGGGGVTVDAENFCCPDYINTMVDIIKQRWNQKQTVIGVTTMKFTIRRDGTIEGIQREKSSGFDVLDTEAERALRLARLTRLPREYPNSTLTVHLEFDYVRP
jgi:TonB family protein